MSGPTHTTHHTYLHITENYAYPKRLACDEQGLPNEFGLYTPTLVCGCNTLSFSRPTPLRTVCLQNSASIP